MELVKIAQIILRYKNWEIENKDGEIKEMEEIEDKEDKEDEENESENED